VSKEANNRKFKNRAKKLRLLQRRTQRKAIIRCKRSRQNGSEEEQKLIPGNELQIEQQMEKNRGLKVDVG
jgi:hypothetical protein